MRTFAELVAEGRIKYVGLSEVTPQELRRAHVVHPVSAVEMEYSLTERGVEPELLSVARELGIGVVAYSPLGRGLLSGAFTSLSELPEGDYRTTLPIFASSQNEARVGALQAIAARKRATPAQLALAWLLAQGDDIVPIPGTKSVSRLEENLAAAGISLTTAEAAEIAAAVPLNEDGRLGSAWASTTWNARHVEQKKAAEAAEGGPQAV
jgi:aryl-alcohol dehydrogenase-like predicted oxidoreductase